MANDLARWQFATTSIYHFLFVPVTIGLAFLVAILPIATVPELFIHSKDLFVKKGSISRTGVEIAEMHWQ